MKNLARAFAEHAVRLSFFLTLLFAIGIVLVTGKFVLFDEGEIGTDTQIRDMQGIDRDVFESATTTLERKTSASTTVPAGLRDPFSPPPRPAAPPPAPEPEVETEAPAAETPADQPAETP